MDLVKEEGIRFRPVLGMVPLVPLLAPSKSCLLAEAGVSGDWWTALEKNKEDRRRGGSKGAVSMK